MITTCPRGRQHAEHFFVVRVRKRPILNDAGVASHLDDEGLIAGSRGTQLNGWVRGHASIVAAVPSELITLFCRAEPSRGLMPATWLRRRRLARLGVSVVGGLVFLGRDILKLAVQSAVVDPVGPFHCGVIDVGHRWQRRKTARMPRSYCRGASPSAPTNVASRRAATPIMTRVTSR